MDLNDDSKKEDVFRFGYWPEITGLVVMGGIVWFMFALSNMV